MWFNDSTASSGPFIRVMQMATPSIEAGVFVTAPANRLLAGQGAEDAGRVGLTALGLQVTGIRISVRPCPFGPAAVIIAWPANLGPPELLARITPQIQNIFVQITQQMAAQATQAAELWDALGLPGQVEEDVARAAYREACKRNHPDVGGSHEAMTALNQSWSKLCELMGWK